MKAEDLVKQRKEERRERKYYSAKDICISMRNKVKRVYVPLTWVIGTEREKEENGQKK